MGDDEREEAAEASCHGADTILPEAFEDDAKQDGTPGHEDPGRVEVGHWRTLMEPHAVA